MRRSALLVAAVLAAVLAGAACGEAPDVPPPFAYRLVDDGDGGGWAETGGVRIEFEVPVVHTTMPLARRETAESLEEGRVRKRVDTVEGHYFHAAGGFVKVDGLRLRIGERDFGPLARGDVVRITARGILVNGAPRAEVATR